VINGFFAPKQVPAAQGEEGIGKPSWTRWPNHQDRPNHGAAQETLRSQAEGDHASDWVAEASSSGISIAVYRLR
jgi:hypothetical protein